MITIYKYTSGNYSNNGITYWSHANHYKKSTVISTNYIASESNCLKVFSVWRWVGNITQAFEVGNTIDVVTPGTEIGLLVWQEIEH